MSDQADKENWYVQVDARSVPTAKGRSAIRYQWRILIEGSPNISADSVYQSNPHAPRYYETKADAYEAGLAQLERMKTTATDSGRQPKRKKRPRDANRLAKSIVDIATGEIEDREPTPEEQGKDPAAVSLGRRGGLKGGKARSQAMPPEQRSAIAKAAAKARWSKQK